VFHGRFEKINIYKAAVKRGELKEIFSIAVFADASTVRFPGGGLISAV
jgi:hypothetical protein